MKDTRDIKIIKNAARCRRCGTTIESKYRHDFVACPCGNFVDGGRAYLRRGGKLKDLEDLSETVEVVGDWCTCTNSYECEGHRA